MEVTLFQFTPLREGRLAVTLISRVCSKFQFTPLREGRPGDWQNDHQGKYFNSRPSARGDPGDLKTQKSFALFQFTPLREGRQAQLHGSWFSISFQFTPLREGRREVADIWHRNRDISIHAPPRGATRGCGQGDGCRCISIHAPPRGATKENLLTMALEIISIHAPPRGATVWLDEEPLDWPFQFTPLREGRQIAGTHARRFPHFNSRPSARGDASARNVPRKPLISIHAPPRGATTAKPQGLGAFQFQFTPLREGRRVSFASRKPVSPNFNSRPSARGDPIPAHGDSTFPFQFTPLREGRRVTRSPTPQAANFNSRPSARGDLMPFRHFPCLSISIHAPPRGATAHRPAAQAELHYFNSRPSARGDLKCLITGCAHLAISIHAPPRGATHRICPWLAKKLISIHAAPRGATAPIGADGRLVDISIHAPPRGATCVPRRADGACAFQFTPLREGRRAFPPLVRR